MAILSCRNLCVGHDGHAIADSISFDIEKGDYVAIVGENGSGKSTLVSTLLGIIPPISGDMTFSDTMPKVGYLPQTHPMQHDFPALVQEVVLSGTLHRSGAKWFASKEDKSKAKLAMSQLGIEDLAKRKFSQLSGGQRQRVLLARALCAADDLLVLDEPVSGLDPTAAEDMYNVVKKLHDETGISVLTITHDIPGGLRDATHVLAVGSPSVFMTIEEYGEVSTDGMAR